MAAKISIYWGERPSEESENDFLAQLKSDLNNSDTDAVILANFFTRTNSRQIDFIIITAHSTCLVELKNFEGVLMGGNNGPWKVLEKDGSERIVERQNPYTQALTNKFSFADDIRIYQSQTQNIPGPKKSNYYEDMNAYVCIYPALQAGSNLPRDYKVRCLGYAELLNILTAPSGKSLRWNFKHWTDFAKDFYLLCASDKLPLKLSIKDSELLLDGYLNSFAKAFEDYSSWVDLTYKYQDKIISTKDIKALIEDGVLLQLIGVSGVGKSHSAFATALAMKDGGWVPFVLDAKLYSGQLSGLIERSVASLTRNTLANVLRAGSLVNKQFIVILDGFNECPSDMRQQLINDLSAMLNRTDWKLLITSQEEVKPLSDRGVVIRATEPSIDEKIQILTHYNADDRIDYKFLTTAFDLKIAAECSREVGLDSTRSELISLYIEKCLESNGDVMTARRILRVLAKEMNEGLTNRIVLSDYYVIVEKIIKQNSQVTVRNLLTSKLISLNQGYITFKHEQIARFFMAENIVIEVSNPKELHDALLRPRNYDVREFAISLYSGEKFSILETINDQSIIEAAYDNQLGLPLKVKIINDTVDALKQYSFWYSTVSLKMNDVFDNQFSPAAQYAAYQTRLMSLAGRSYGDRLFNSEVLKLFESADSVCLRATESNDKLAARSSAVAAVYIMQNKGRSPAHDILERIRLSNFPYEEAGAVSVQTFGEMLKLANRTSYGLLLALCYSLHGRNKDGFLGYVYSLFKLCWESGVYHVRLEGLYMAQSFAYKSDSDELQDLKDYISDIEATNIWIASTITELKYAFDLIEPIIPIDDVRKQIKEVLDGGENEDNYQRAASIVSRQYEDILSDAYYGAIEELPKDDKVKLLSYALLEADFGWGADWTLSQLVELHSVESVPALLRHATKFHSNSPMQQDAVAAHILAMAAVSEYVESPPLLAMDEEYEKQQEVWSIYDEIIFYSYRKDFDKSLNININSLWEKLADYSRVEALEPLYRMSTTVHVVSRGGISVYDRLIKNFSNKIRLLAEEYLSSSVINSEVTNKSAPFEMAENYALELLGVVGTVEHSVPVLNRYVEDSGLGVLAIKSINRIQNRNRVVD